MRSALVPILLNSVPGWVRSNYGLLVPSVVMHFDEGRAWVQGVGSVDPATLITTVRASNETTLLPSSASGAAYQTFLSNVPAIVSGSGLQEFQAATNLLLNSTAPVTQTTASLGTGTYTLWVNGTGSAASSAGSATGSGFGAATTGVPNTFTLTVAGTVTVTVTGSLNAFQLQSGSIGTALVVTAGATATQAADTITLAGAALALARPASGWLVAKLPQGATSQSYTLVRKVSPSDAYLFAQASTTASALVSSSGVANATIGSGGTFAGSVRYAVTWDGTGIANVANGGTVSTTATPFGATDGSPMYLGSSGSGNNSINGYISRLAVGNTRLTNAQIQALAQ